MAKKYHRRGFTMIECLVVLGVAFVMIALNLPAVQKARDAARSSQCKNNLKQYGLAIHNYADTFGRLPAGIQVGFEPGKTINWSWQVQLLPFLDQEKLSLQLKESGDVSKAAQAGLLSQNISFMKCPSDLNSDVVYSEKVGLFAGNWSTTDYLGVSGIGVVQSSGSQDMFSSDLCTQMEELTNVLSKTGMLFENSHLKVSEVEDGTSNTTMIGERGLPMTGEYGWWTGPGNAGTCPVGWMDVVLSANGGVHAPSGNLFEDGMHWWSNHVDGVNFTMADGSVRSFSYEIDPTIFLKMSTRAGNDLEF